MTKKSKTIAPYFLMIVPCYLLPFALCTDAKFRVSTTFASCMSAYLDQ